MAGKSVSIRIEEELLRKLSQAADYEGRSVSSHVLALIRENIRAFEKEHGPAEGAITPDVNVKPARKERKQAEIPDFFILGIDKCPAQAYNNK